MTAALLGALALLPPAGVFSQATARPEGALAILEMRAGAAQLPGLGDRLAAVACRATSWAIIAPAEARRRTPRVDAAVARCAGEAACLAEIGRQLGVRRLLVVAVSQLGDLIVALQLVDTETRQVTARIAESLSPERLVTDDDLRAWLERTLPPEAFVRWGTISVRANMDGATVEIDGKRQGSLPLPPLTLRAPHLYKVRISKPGHKPFNATVDLHPDMTVEVAGSLPPQATTRWYARPGLWAALVSGVAVGAFVGIRLASPSPTKVTGYVEVHPDTP